MPPTVRVKNGGTFAPCFVAPVSALGVPLWAFSIGKMVENMLRAESERAMRNSRLVRERAAEDALRRLEARDGVPEAVDRTEFLELWLLRAGILSEATLRIVDDEFDVLRTTAGRADGRALVADISTRLRYNGLLERKVEPGGWAEYRAAVAADAG